MKLKELVRYLVKKNELDLKLNPNDPQALLNTGMIIEIMGNTEEAMRIYQKITDIDPTYPMSFFRIGLIKYKENDFIEAQKNFDKTVILDHYNIDGLYYSGRTAVVLGQHQTAVNYFERVISLVPFHKSAWNDKGIAQIMLEEPEEALKCFDFLISMDPKDKNAWYQKGIALEDMGLPDEAKKCYKKANMYPENAEEQMAEMEQDDISESELEKIQSVSELEKFLKDNPQLKI